MVDQRKLGHPFSIANAVGPVKSLFYRNYFCDTLLSPHDALLCVIQFSAALTRFPPARSPVTCHPLSDLRQLLLDAS